MRVPTRRPGAVPALLAVLVVAMLLVPGANAAARTARKTCPAHATTRAKPATHPCERPARKHPANSRRRTRHSASKKRAKKGHKPSGAPAFCEVVVSGEGPSGGELEGGWERSGGGEPPAPGEQLFAVDQPLPGGGALAHEPPAGGEAEAESEGEAEGEGGGTSCGSA